MLRMSGCLPWIYACVDWQFSMIDEVTSFLRKIVKLVRNCILSPLEKTEYPFDEVVKIVELILDLVGRRGHWWREALNGYCPTFCRCMAAWVWKLKFHWLDLAFHLRAIGIHHRNDDVTPVCPNFCQDTVRSARGLIGGEWFQNCELLVQCRCCWFLKCWIFCILVLVILLASFSRLSHFLLKNPKKYVLVWCCLMISWRFLTHFRLLVHQSMCSMLVYVHLW